jgi:hypothetical protein
MQKVADTMLGHAEALFRGSADLDTAVRDIVYEGLARIVYAAYDTQAFAQVVADFDSISYIQTKTYNWFRDRDFVEWFCVAASTLFRNSRNDAWYRVAIASPTKGKGIKVTHEKVS